MALPVVAIIGRPNVGKSSLLNALSGEMISIVEPQPGVTRDRVSTIIGRDDKYFELVDTGGYGIVDADQLEEHVEGQIRRALESANLVLFMVDIRDGVVPLDEAIARMLRKQGLAVLGVANKADTVAHFGAAGEFTKLGFGQFLCVSVKNNMNKQVLLDRIFERLEGSVSVRPAEPVMKIAIIGRRNAGKSTMVNAMVGSERVIVSETPGTTRDAVDVRFEKDGHTIVVIDTAGLRKKKMMFSDNIEFYGYVRATRSIRRADVVLLLTDAALPISQVDKKIARFVTDEYKSCIVVVNKWDLAKGRAVTGDYEQYLTKTLPGLKYVPIAFTTATDGKNVQSLLDLAAQIFKQATTWLGTARLNKAFEIIKQQRGGNVKAAKGRPRIYYATQVAVNPVTILMFVNRPALFDDSYAKFIAGKLRELLPIDEVPVRLLVRPRRDEGKHRKAGEARKSAQNPRQANR